MSIKWIGIISLFVDVSEYLPCFIFYYDRIIGEHKMQVLLMLVILFISLSSKTTGYIIHMLTLF